MILRGREKDSKYETEIASTKSETTSLVGEIIILRTRVYSGSNDGKALRVKCIQLSLEHEKDPFTHEGVRSAVGISPA